MYQVYTLTHDNTVTFPQILALKILKFQRFQHFPYCARIIPTYCGVIAAKTQKRALRPLLIINIII